MKKSFIEIFQRVGVFGIIFILSIGNVVPALALEEANIITPETVVVVPPAPESTVVITSVEEVTPVDEAPTEDTPVFVPGSVEVYRTRMQSVRETADVPSAGFGPKEGDFINGGTPPMCENTPTNNCIDVSDTVITDADIAYERVTRNIPPPGGNGGVVIVVSENMITDASTSALPIIPSPSPEALPGTISGKVFHDADEDGVLDAGELSLENWEVQLYDASSMLVSSDLTNQNGKYHFADVNPGTYEVRMVLPGMQWEESFPGTGNPQIVVMGQNEGFLDKDFGIVKLATVSGYLWYDINNDGIWQKDGILPEPALENWALKARQSVLPTEVLGGGDGGGLGDGGLITVGPNSANFGLGRGDAEVTDPAPLVDNGIMKRAVTDANGWYQFVFNSLEVGDWAVSEMIQDGWVMTHPTTPRIYSVLVETGADTSDKDFGNLQLFEVLGMKLAPFSTDPLATLAALVFSGNAIVFPSGSVVSVPTGSTIGAGETFNVNEMTALDVLPSEVSGLGANVVPRGAIQFGIKDRVLSLSQPMGISIAVDSLLNGETLDVVTSPSGSGDWGTDGIVPPATCIIAGASCTFASNNTGYFAATLEAPQDTTPPSDEGDSSSSGGGNDPGGGGPIVPFVPPAPEGNTGGEGGNTTNPPAGEETAISGESASPIASALALNNALGGETVFAGEGIPEIDLTGFPGVEDEAVSSETAEQSNAGFLATAGSFLTFGTGNMLLGIISILIILALLWYVYRTFFSEKRKDLQKV